MYDGEKLFLNMLVFFSAVAYWFATSHAIPALLGVVVVGLYFFDENLSLPALIITIITLLMMIVYFFIDYYYFDEGDNFAQFGFSALYMGVLYFKSKSIFNAE
jgi:hypothetical protein